MARVDDARALVAGRGFGCLSTVSVRHAGFPFVSITEYATDEAGQPVLLLSGLAVHTKNLAADARASLIVFAEDAEKDVLGSARVTLMGMLRKVDDGGDSAIRARYLDRHPQAAQWVDFGDFAFFRMDVADVYYVGGFGEMGWVGGGDFRSAAS